MATFKAEVYAHQKRADGTWNIKIQPEIKPIFDKYRDPIDQANRKVLDFIKLDICNV